MVLLMEFLFLSCPPGGFQVISYFGTQKSRAKWEEEMCWKFQSWSTLESFEESLEEDYLRECKMWGD